MIYKTEQLSKSFVFFLGARFRKYEERRMVEVKLLEMAQAIGVNQYTLKSSKKSIIRAIQRARGQQPCFLSDLRYSCAVTCEWDGDCKKLTAAWLR